MRAYRANARYKRGLQHIARNTGVHAYDYLCIVIGFLCEYISTRTAESVNKLGRKL